MKLVNCNQIHRPCHRSGLYSIYWFVFRVHRDVELVVFVFVTWNRKECYLHGLSARRTSYASKTKKHDKTHVCYFFLKNSLWIFKYNHSYMCIYIGGGGRGLDNWAIFGGVIFKKNSRIKYRVFVAKCTEFQYYQKKICVKFLKNLPKKIKFCPVT